MAVVDHAVDSRGLSIASTETAAWLSLVAYVRHTFTDYSQLKVTIPTGRDILWSRGWIKSCGLEACIVAGQPRTDYAEPMRRVCLYHRTLIATSIARDPHDLLRPTRINESENERSFDSRTA